ncbi:tetrahydromethanopterin synthesis protein [Methylobacillus sp. MM3]|uniref:DUF447 domain-containing protein n=1 Tax=Methylobacillus sp. MM3 TaxID=1848039 RepID=UPI0007DF9CA8|nr:DUF447 domain-containing protein [Methylobacillus sp. MM3]OAJ71259.1 tetrahydromethanopterin synthesis protein [Methylobacillus sp. MM3]
MIYETVITTVNADGSAHIAPFGIRERDGMIIIAPFRPSISLDNLLRTERAVVNLTDDVRVFAGALTGRRVWPVRRAEKIEGYVLDAALAHRELELADIKEDAVRPELTFRVVHEAMHTAFRGFNRAQAAVLEAAVLVSRLHMLPPEKIAAEIAYLTIAIEKTAGDRERQAWSWLIERIENYNAEQRGENQA